MSNTSHADATSADTSVAQSDATTTSAETSRNTGLKLVAGLAGAGGGLLAGGVALLATGDGVVRVLAGIVLLVLCVPLLLAAGGLVRDPAARAAAAARTAGQTADGDAPAPAVPDRDVPAQVVGGAQLSEGFTVAGNRAQRRAAARRSSPPARRHRS